MDQFLLLQANGTPIFTELEQPDKSKLHQFDLLAYTGGAVDLGLKYNVVFDLSSTQSNKSTPLLMDHDPKIIVGHASKVLIAKKDINANGVMSGVKKETQEIIGSAHNGYPWQLSVGIASKELFLLKGGSSSRYNEQQFEGPLYIAKNNLLREISFLSLGADPNTYASLRSSFFRCQMMTFEDWVKDLGFDVNTLTPEQTAALKVLYDDEMMEENETGTMVARKVPLGENERKLLRARAKKLHASLIKSNPVLVVVPPNTDNDINNIVIRTRNAVTVESERIDKIKLLNAKYNEPKDSKGIPIFTLAVKDGWDLTRTELEMMRAARPNRMIVNDDDNSDTAILLEAAICQAGRMSNLDKRFPVQILDAAHKKFKSRISLQEVLLHAAMANGYSGSWNVKSDLVNILRAAFSTKDISGTLSNVANKYLVEGYFAVDQAWRQIARRRTAVDFKEFSGYRAVGGFTFEKIGPDGMIPHGKMTEQQYGNKVDTYAKMFAITRQDIYNDNLGALTDVPRMIGRGGAIGFNKVFWTEFLDNSTFFVAGNNNVATGALAIPGLNTLNGVFRKLKDPNGDFISATPKILLVPTELEPTAMSLYGSENIVSGVTTTGGIPGTNPWVRKFVPVASPYLSDPTIPGNSTTAHYLLADPNDVPVIEAAFLEGNETPTVESADVDFYQLGIQVRGFYDYGVRKQDPNGGVRSTGV